MNRFFYPLCVTGLGCAATAQTVLWGDCNVADDLCVGGACTSHRVFANDLNAKLRVKGTGIGIVQQDTGATSMNDWALRANAPNEGSFFSEDRMGTKWAEC